MTTNLLDENEKPRDILRRLLAWVYRGGDMKAWYDAEKLLRDRAPGPAPEPANVLRCDVCGHQPHRGTPEHGACHFCPDGDVDRRCLGHYRLEPRHG